MDKTAMSLDDIIKSNKDKQQQGQNRPPRFRGHVRSRRPFPRPMAYRPIRQRVIKTNKSKPQGERPIDKKRIFLSSLQEDVTNAELRDMFTPFGELQKCFIYWDNLGRSKGIAQVEYSSEEEAAKAMEEWNGKELKGELLSISYSKNE